jgi:hypothetical protein
VSIEEKKVTVEHPMTFGATNWKGCIP